MTPLDTAHKAMEAAPADDAARLKFYERLVDSELVLLLEAEPQGDQASPQIFDTGEGRFVLVFDREERLITFAEKTAPYVALPGRAIAGMLAGQGIGMGLNLGVAPSSFLIPSDAVDWLAATLGTLPDEVEERPDELSPPTGLPERLIEGLDAKLARAEGLARFAYLAAVTYGSGRRGHLLAFIDTMPEAEPSLARAVSEALVFSGLEAGELDVAFFRATDEVAARLAKVGLRFDLPELPSPEGPKPPGMDPDTPPKLR